MNGFTWLDYGILIGYLVGVTVLGSLFVKGTDEGGREGAKGLADLEII